MQYIKPLQPYDRQLAKERIQIADKISPIEINYFKLANMLSIGFKTIESEKWKVNPNVTHVGSFYTFTDRNGHECIKRDGMRTITEDELTAVLRQYNDRLSVVDDEPLVI